MFWNFQLYPGVQIGFQNDVVFSTKTWLLELLLHFTEYPNHLLGNNWFCLEMSNKGSEFSFSKWALRGVKNCPQNPSCQTSFYILRSTRWKNEAQNIAFKDGLSTILIFQQ